MCIPHRYFPLIEDITLMNVPLGISPNNYTPNCFKKRDTLGDIINDCIYIKPTYLMLDI